MFIILPEIRDFLQIDGYNFSNAEKAKVGSYTSRDISALSMENIRGFLINSRLL